MVMVASAQKNHHKTVYFDGHERSDVVEYRKEFVSYMADINKRCKYDGNFPELDRNEKPIVVHHNESTFYANADQSRYWGDDYNTVLKQKSLGQSIMISDFIEEATGDFLCHNDEKARKLVETDTSIANSSWNRWIRQLTYLKPSFQTHRVCFYLIIPPSIRNIQMML